MSAGSIKMAVGGNNSTAKSTNISSDLRNPRNVGGRKKMVHTATKG